MQDRIDGLETSITALNKRAIDMEKQITIMSIHIEFLRASEEARSKRMWAIGMTAIGAVVASFVAWLVGGGMNVK